eukprot:TRINITY_DN1359_c0_g2_i1.p1 TRINITY_DN1359_c0_g2~~TRINITY_DN1359_c0_g2_i1.p1  ORF type:complete len:128 (-),score=44.88 TRINITY_DN1359_c0_g2_i1:256-639(-)
MGQENENLVSGVPPQQYQQPGFSNQPPNYNPQQYQQGYVPQNTVVYVNNNPGLDNSAVGQIVAFVVGFFCCCAWVFGFFQLKHENPLTRIFAIINAVLFSLVCFSFVLGFVFFLVWLIFVVAVGASL